MNAQLMAGLKASEDSFENIVHANLNDMEAALERTGDLLSFSKSLRELSIALREQAVDIREQSQKCRERVVLDRESGQDGLAGISVNHAQSATSSSRQPATVVHRPQFD